MSGQLCSEFGIPLIISHFSIALQLYHLEARKNYSILLSSGDNDLTDVWYCRKPFSNQPIYSIIFKGPGAWFWLVKPPFVRVKHPQLLDCFINWVPPWIVGSPFLQHQTGLHLPILDNFHRRKRRKKMELADPKPCTLTQLVEVKPATN